MRNILGYFLGFAIFIAGVPALMWWFSGQPQMTDSPLLRLVVAAVVEALVVVAAVVEALVVGAAVVEALVVAAVVDAFVVEAVVDGLVVDFVVGNLLMVVVDYYYC